MIDRRTFLTASGLIGSGIAGMGVGGGLSLLDGGTAWSAPAGPPVPPVGDSARANPADIATAKGLCFGTCIANRPFANDAAYNALNARFSNTLVHGSALQWHELQQQKGGPYDFRNADAMVDWADQKKRHFRGHAMLDWSGLPDWLEPMIASLSPKDAEALLRDHVRRIGSRYRGRMIQWNVANEPMSGSSVRPYGWFKKLDENYLDIAFDEAAKADPGVPLAINQNLIEMDSRFQRGSRDATLELVRRLKDRKVPIASVGIEGHLLSQYGVDQDGMLAFVKALGEMGIGFMITELDVDDRAFAADPAGRDQSVAALTRDFLDVTLSQPNCEGLIFWGFQDRYNWLNIDKSRSRPDDKAQRSTILDDDDRPKSMWRVTIDALKKAPGPGKASLLKA
jgi:endo-1,4-beta-xylanase